MDNLETLVTYGTGHRTKTSNTKKTRKRWVISTPPNRVKPREG